MAARKTPSGLPPDEKERQSNEIIQRVSTGEPLAKVCRELGLGLTTWYDWMAKSPPLAERFARARKDGFDAIAEQALAIADELPERTSLGSIDGGSVQHAKLRIETRLKLLAKWDPKRYGERLEVAGDADAPLQVQVVKRMIVDPKSNGT